MEYQVKRGFGAKKEKEFFVVEADGDIMAGVVGGPFESFEQGMDAIEGLRPLYKRRLVVIGGHLVGWRNEVELPEG